MSTAITGSSVMMRQSTSIPSEMKKKLVNASRSGMMSLVARCV